MSQTNIINNEEQLKKIFYENTLIVDNCDTLVFRNYQFNGDFIIKSIHYDFIEDVEKDQTPLSLIFEDCTFEKDFSIDFTEIGSFQFKILKIVNTKKKKKTIEKLILKNFEVEKFYFKEYDCDLVNLYNIDFIEDSKVIFENLEVNKLLLEKISQDSKFIQFHQVTVNNELYSERVEFKNTYFNDFKLDTANIELVKTSFIDAHLNSVVWGDLSRIVAKKDIIRQLKYVNDSIGNYIEGNKFFAQEMEIHQKEVRKKKGNYLENIILFFNKEISNFGQNWFLPLVWFIVITFSIILLKNEEVNSIYFILFFSIILLGSIFRMVDYLIGNTYSNNLKIFILPLCIVIFLYYYENSCFLDLAYLLSYKPPNYNTVFLQYWILHKVLIAFPLYHFTISLRRLTKR